MTAPDGVSGQSPAQDKGRAKTVYVHLSHGKRALDLIAGNGQLAAGHDRTRIIDALLASPNELASTALCNRLRQAVARLMPPLLGDVSLTTSAEQALGHAVAMARAYHASRGRPGRRSVIVCGPHPGNSQVHAPLRDSILVERCDGAAVRSALQKLGTQQVAALLLEPLGFAGGLRPLQPDQAEELDVLCERSGIVLISDETLGGMGRTGMALAAQSLGLKPDIAFLGEILTNGAAPLGAVVARPDVAAALQKPDEPLLAGRVMAALENLAIHEDEQLFGRSLELEHYWQHNIQSLAGAPVILDVRCLGLAAAIEIRPRAGQPGARGQLLFQRARDYGVLPGVRDDTILLTPPLTITKDQIDDIVEKLSAALRKIT